MRYCIEQETATWKRKMAFKIHVIDVQNQLQNYIWLIEECNSHNVVVIDPTELVLLEYCQKHQLNLSQICSPIGTKIILSLCYRAEG